jgi:hypothetical protein
VATVKNPQNQKYVGAYRYTEGWTEKGKILEALARYFVQGYSDKTCRGQLDTQVCSPGQTIDREG